MANTRTADPLERHPGIGARGWQSLSDDLAAAVRAVRPGQFVLLEFVEHEGIPAWDPWPYAQCAWTRDGWYCEAVSENFLTASAWPQDELYLRRAGWAPAQGPDDNWSMEVDRAEAAAEAMVDALRRGRDCADPRCYRWTVGTFPPGPDGGVPLVGREVVAA